MHITQVRNATLIVEYAGVKFLIDPMLADKGSFPAFVRTANELPNPLVHLPMSIDAIIDVDAVIVTHLHKDHWDEKAEEVIPKAKPLFAQNIEDASYLEGRGFTNVDVLSSSSVFSGVSLVKVRGQHGSDDVMNQLRDRLGHVCGVVFKHPDEDVLYIAGDTVWNDYVSSNLDEHQPKVVVLNAGDARINNAGPIIMGVEDVNNVALKAPYASIFATHLEAVNHAMLSRQELWEFAVQNGFSDRISIPQDGECITFS